MDQLTTVTPAPQPSFPHPTVIPPPQKILSIRLILFIQVKRQSLPPLPNGRGAGGEGRTHPITARSAQPHLSLRGAQRRGNPVANPRAQNPVHPVHRCKNPSLPPLPRWERVGVRVITPRPKNPVHPVHRCKNPPPPDHPPLDNQNNCSYYGLCQVNLRCQSQRSITATRQHQNRKPARCRTAAVYCFICAVPSATADATTLRAATPASPPFAEHGNRG